MNIIKNINFIKKKIFNVLVTTILLISIFSPLALHTLAEPNPPSGFIATTYDRFGINLSWSNIGNNHTYIEWNISESWPRGDGERLENSSTNTSYNHSSLNPGTQYFYQAWSYNTTTHNYSINYSKTDATTNQNNAPSFTGEIPVNGSLDVSINPVLSVWVDDSDGDLLDVYWYSNSSGVWALFASNLSVDPGSGALNISQINSNFSEYSTNYWWCVNCFDGYDWTNVTHHFTTRVQYIPNSPSNFTATTISSSQINLAWIKGDKADYTHVRRKTGSYPTSILDGTDVYNDIGNTYIDLDLLEGATYYYSAWSWNNTDKTWSPTQSNISNTTSNKPTISNPIPINGSIGVSLIPLMNITINDLDGNLMTIKWYSNSSGPWELFGCNESIGNGTYHQFNTNFSSYGTTYWWNISVDDGKDVSYSDVFHFTTNHKPTITDPIPSNGSIGVNLRPIMNITVNDADGDLMTVRWYSNSSGSWRLFGNNITVVNGTYHQTNSNFSGFGTTYWWNVTVNDGTDSKTSEIYHFITRTKFIPDPPSFFNSTAFNRTQINLSWTKSDNTDAIYVENNTYENWSRGQGTELYNETNLKVSHTDLDFNTKYYYQAWSWNITDNVWSNNYSSANATTYANKAPNLTGEYPANGSTNISINPVLSVLVNDSDGDLLDVYWYSNATGPWKRFGKNLSVDPSSGAVNISQSNDSFNSYNTKYWWSVNCSDGTNWTNETYRFTRGPNIPPSPFDPDPGDDAENVTLKPVCRVNVTDANNDQMTVYFYENTTIDAVTLDYQVNSDYDDAFYYDDGMVKDRGYVLFNYHNTNKVLGGLRFKNVDIPQGATIISANISVYPKVWYDSACDIYGDDTDDSEAIENGTSLDKRILTSASVSWYEDDLSGWTSSPDISSVIQEIVDQSEWKSGNNLTIITDDIQSDKRFGIYDRCSLYYPDRAAKLYITYGTGRHLWKRQQVNTSVDSGDAVVWNNFANASNYLTDYWWSVNITDGTNWTNKTYHFTTAPNNLPTINNEIPYHGSVDVDPVPTLSVTVDDADGETLTVNWNSNSTGTWTTFATNNNVDTSTGEKVLYQTNDDFKDYNTTYWWNVTAWDGNEINNSDIFHFTTREQYIPDPPDNLEASTINSTQINLTWTKGDKVDKTRIQRKTGNYPTSILDGTNVYNDTGNTSIDANLLEGIKYYYSAWSWNNTDKTWSLTQFNISNTTNNKPAISKPIPSNESIGVKLIPQMNITVNDSDTDLMTIKWYSNVSGSWELFGRNEGIVNGTYHPVNTTNFSSYGTTYWWNVSVDDGKDISKSNIFHFTTNHKPTITDEIPENNSIGIPLQPLMNITVYDVDGDLMTVKWYSNRSGPWMLFGVNSNVTHNTTCHRINNNFSSHNTTYWWNVSVDDGKDVSYSDVFHFTTNNKPTITDPIPENGSTNVRVRPKMNITVYDVDGDLLNVSWYSNVSGDWGLFDVNYSVTSGSTCHQINNNFSSHNTMYWWNVSVDDGKDISYSDVFQFTTAPNNKPNISNENPENGSINVSKIPILNVTVNDIDADYLDVYWYSNSTGSWKRFGKNSSVDPINGPVNISQNNTNFSKYSTTYWWSVNVTDATDWVNKTFHFTTKKNTPPTQNNTIPSNSTTGVCPKTLNFTITVDDTNNDNMNITLKTNTSGSWKTFNSTTNVLNGTYIFTNTTWVSSPGTRYWWSVNLTDNTNWTNMTYSFTTNYKPKISNVTPSNGSMVSPKPTCNVTVSDNDNDTIDVYFYENTSAYPGASQNYQVNHDEDDAYFYNGSMFEAEDRLFFNYNKNKTTMAGIRFRNVDIPQGATILAANISIYLAAAIGATNDSACDIYGDDTNDSEVIENGTSLDKRDLTSASVPWYEDDLGNGWAFSPDVSPIIQEIVNRPGWKRGNNITIISNDNQNEKWLLVYDYSQSSSKAARLSITYSGIEWTLRQNNSVASESHVSWKNNIASTFNTTHWWALHAFDGCSWTNNTYNFITRNQYIPELPETFNATKFNRTQINLSWRNPPGNETYIEFNTIETWEQGEGNSLYNLYNGTAKRYNHSNLNPGTQYFYQAWGYNVTDNGFSTSYLPANATTDENNVPTLSGETPTNNSDNIDIYQSTVNVTIKEGDDEPFDWTIEGKYVNNTGNTSDSNGSKSADILVPLPYNTSIIWYVNATDGLEWTNATYNFTTRPEYIPHPPTNFAVKTYNRTQINLSWTNAVNNHTYIEWNLSQDWNRGNGTHLYSGTNTSYNHSSLNPGTQYFYQAWSYNTTDKVYSNQSVSANATTYANHLPKFGNPNIDNGSSSHPLNLTWNISITDADNDLFNWSIECDSGDLNSSQGDKDGTKELSLTGLSQYTKYKIWVNATDGYNWTRKWFTFITKSPHEPPIITNFTATAFNRTTIALTWDNNGTNHTYIEWYNNEKWAPGDGNELEIENNSSNTSYNHSGLNPGTQYFYQAWSYNSTWNVSSTYVEATATTEINHPPTFGTPSPSDGATGQPLALTWSIIITDANNDPFNWTIKCSNGQNNSENNATNGTKELDITDLYYNTQYTVWVNATDGYNSTNATYTFTTRAKYTPDPPSSFSASAGTNSISLSWNKGGKADKTRIQGKTGSYPISINDGNRVYNGTGTSETDIGLLPYTKYYYRAWSWNEQDKTWSTKTATTSATTKSSEEEDDEEDGPIDDYPDGPTAPKNVRWTTSETDNTPEFRWTHAEASAGTTIKGYYVKIDNNNEEEIGNRLSWTSPDPVKEGDHKFYVRAIDSQNVLGSYGSCSFTINTKVRPVANAGGPYYGYILQNITFNGSRSYDPHGNIVNGTWDFGDGTIGYGYNPVHRYLVEGEYNVTLTVIDNESLSDTDTTYAVISPTPNNPPNKPNVTGTKRGTINTEYNYSFQTIDKDGDNISYIIYWRDGSVVTTSPSISSGSTYSTTHTWTTEGVYIIKVYAKDEKNAVSEPTERIVEIDVNIKFIHGQINGYLIDYDQDGDYNTFYNNETQNETTVEKQNDGKYKIDTNGDGNWNHIYNPATGTTTPVGQEGGYPWLDIVIIIIIAVIVVILFLFKTGYLYFEYTTEDEQEKKQTKKSKK